MQLLNVLQMKIQNTATMIYKLQSLKNIVKEKLNLNAGFIWVKQNTTQILLYFHCGVPYPETQIRVVEQRLHIWLLHDFFFVFFFSIQVGGSQT